MEGHLICHSSILSAINFSHHNLQTFSKVAKPKTSGHFTLQFKLELKYYNEAETDIQNTEKTESACTSLRIGFTKMVPVSLAKNHNLLTHQWSRLPHDTHM
jgi:hypothetical protein